MKYGLGEYVRAMSPSKRLARGQYKLEIGRRIASDLELVIERADQGARRCRQCAVVHGRYVCAPSVSVFNEWCHTSADVRLIVNLLACQPDAGARLRAIVVLGAAHTPHARVIYSCDMSTTELQEGSWMLRLESETSECDFVFPAELEVVSRANLTSPREGMTPHGGLR